MKNFFTFLFLMAGCFGYAQTGYSSVSSKQWNKDTVLNTKAMKINSQGGLVVGTYDLNGNAILELNSTTKGFLPTRLNTTQMNAISLPANGLTVYNTDTNDLMRYDSFDGWRRVGAVGGGSYVFENGLTESGGTAVLGGNLTQNTTINGRGTYNFVIDSAQVGIGKTNPLARLHVTTSGNVPFLVGDSTGGAGRRTTIRYSTNSGIQLSTFVGGSYGNYTAQQLGNGSTYGDPDSLTSGGFSWGINNRARGLGSVSLGGGNNYVSGSFSSVIAGSGNNVLGSISAALGGSNNTLSGTPSAVLAASNNTISGARSVAIASNSNTVSGSNSAVLGGAINTSSGVTSGNLISTECAATNDLTTNIGGFQCRAEGDHGTTIGGYRAFAYSYHEVALGNLPNYDTTTAVQETWNSNDYIFHIGCNPNALDTNTRLDGFAISKTGSTVIGLHDVTRRPDTTTAKLTIYGDSFNGGVNNLIEAHTDSASGSVFSIAANGTPHIPLNAGTGKILTSDASGNATWQDAANCLVMDAANSNVYAPCINSAPDMPVDGSSISNTVLGSSAGFGIAGGNNSNSFYGYNTHSTAFSGSNNTAIGSNIGNPSNSIYNTLIGSSISFYADAVTGERNTVVGSEVVFNNDDISNSIAIGNGVTVDASNQLAIADSIHEIKSDGLAGNVGDVLTRDTDGKLRLKPVNVFSYDTVMQIQGTDTLFTIYNADSSRFDINSNLPITINKAKVDTNGVITAANFNRSYTVDSGTVTHNPNIGYYSISTSTVACTFNLDDSSPDGTEVIIKDNARDASSNNITVTSTLNIIGGATGGTTYIIDTNGAAINLKKIGNTWEVF